MGSLGWVGGAPKPHTGSGDGGIATGRLSDVVTWLVLVWFQRQRGMKSRVCDGLKCFEARWAVFSVLEAVGRRAAASPVALPLEIDGSHL